MADLDAWANQAAWTEALQAWAEHAQTLRELSAALHRAGLAQSRLAATSTGGRRTPRDTDDERRTAGVPRAGPRAMDENPGTH